MKLARKHGVSKTRDALRLDYCSIKKRLAVADRASSAITSPASGAGSEDRDRFVELPLRTVPGLSLAPRTCVLEAEDGRGARLHLELQGLGAGELAGVVRAVWGEPG